MKKVLIVFMSILLMISMVGCSGKSGQEVEKKLSLDVNKEIIRFHVLANSDNEKDQALKLKVRDKVIEYLEPKLKESKSLEESREILTENFKKVEEISKEVISDEGYNYGVQVLLTYDNFPEKSYGEYVFPQGRYEAYKILIGDAMGKNWWCVMFPPLCFVDETKSVTKQTSSMEKLEEDYGEKEEVEVQYKFKIFESFKELLAKWF